MEAPKKIYLQEPTKVRIEKKYDNDVEYIRTDAFIEKAVKHIDGLIDFLNEYGHQLKKEYIIKNFKKYMEE